MVGWIVRCLWVSSTCCALAITPKFRESSSGLAEGDLTVLWRADLDRVPPYLSGSTVTLSVVQDGMHRDLVWEAEWFDTIGGVANMGRINCEPNQTERNAIAATPPESLPCRFHGAHGLVSGVGLVQLITSTVVGLRPKRIAMVGLGPGTMATFWQRYAPQVEHIDVVELSPLVVDTARRFFDLSEDSRLKVHVADGVEWLKQMPPCDVFVHDASGSLHHFLWPSSLNLIKEKTSGGTIVMNALGTPWFIRLFGIPYLRLYFEEVRMLDDVIIASWSPITMSWDGIPGYVQRWQRPRSWIQYNRLTSAEIFVPLLTPAFILIAVLLIFHMCLSPDSSRWHEDELPLQKPRLKKFGLPRSEGRRGGVVLYSAPV